MGKRNVANKLKASKYPAGLSLVWTKYDTWILLKPSNTLDNLLAPNVQMQNEIYPSELDTVVAFSEPLKTQIQPSIIKLIFSVSKHNAFNFNNNQ